MLFNKPRFTLFVAVGAVALCNQTVLAEVNAYIASARHMAQSCGAERREEYSATLATATLRKDEPVAVMPELATMKPVSHVLNSATRATRYAGILGRTAMKIP
jgi:hypothetical protein